MTDLKTQYPEETVHGHKSSLLNDSYRGRDRLCYHPLKAAFGTHGGVFLQKKARYNQSNGKIDDKQSLQRQGAETPGKELGNDPLDQHLRDQEKRPHEGTPHQPPRHSGLQTRATVNEIDPESSEVSQKSADEINAVAFPETRLFDLVHLSWNRTSNEPAVQARPYLGLRWRRRAMAFALGAPGAQAGVHRVPGLLRVDLGDTATRGVVFRRLALAGGSILVARGRHVAGRTGPPLAGTKRFPGGCIHRRDFVRCRGGR